MPIQRLALLLLLVSGLLGCGPRPHARSVAVGAKRVGTPALSRGRGTRARAATSRASATPAQTSRTPGRSPAEIAGIPVVEEDYRPPSAEEPQLSAPDQAQHADYSASGPDAPVAGEPENRPTAAGSYAPSTASDQDIVHITETGTRYHRAGCRSLSKSDIPVTRAEAQARGLTPCSLCNP